MFTRYVNGGSSSSSKSKDITREQEREHTDDETEAFWPKNEDHHHQHHQYRQHRNYSDSADTAEQRERLTELNMLVGNTGEGLASCKWVMVYCALPFYCCALFDMVGDSHGLASAVFVPLCLVSFVVVARLGLLKGVDAAMVSVCGWWHRRVFDRI